MADMPIIAIFADQPGQGAYLAEIVQIAGYAPHIGDMPDAVISVKSGEAGLAVTRPDGTTRPVKVPVRAGEFIGLLRKIMNESEALPATFAIGDGVLDVRDSLWLRAGQPPLRLTEKEVAILVSLKNAGGRAVPRQALLDQVWAYAQGVETHTLETHIYRLRQKIEADPATPKILLTQEDGYVLGE